MKKSFSDTVKSYKVLLIGLVLLALAAAVAVALLR